jgi:hypothetical protein
VKLIFHSKESSQGQARWFNNVIPATWEPEAGRWEYMTSLNKGSETLSQKQNEKTERVEVVECLT